MTNVLLVTCNSETTGTNLRRTTGDVIGTMRRTDPGLVVRERHLSPGAIPPIGSVVATALRTPVARRTAAQWKAVVLLDVMLQEIRSADVLLITAPLADGELPAELAGWIAHVAEAARLAPDERRKHCALHDVKVALVVVEPRPGGEADCADLAPFRAALLASLAPLGVNDVVLFEADADGYPLRAATILLIVSRVAHP